MGSKTKDAEPGIEADGASAGENLRMDERPMIIATMKMIVSPEKRKDLLQAVRGVLEPIEVEPGCMCCRLYEDTTEENTFVLLQVWSSRKTLERHLGSESFRILLTAMELLIEPPEVTFCTVARKEGFEVIEEARSRKTDGGAVRKFTSIRERTASSRDSGRTCLSKRMAYRPILDGRIGYGTRNGK